MFGILAVVCFTIAFIFHGAATVTNAWLDPTSLMLAGLAFLALHLLGYGASWTPRR